MAPSPQPPCHEDMLPRYLCSLMSYELYTVEQKKRGWQKDTIPAGATPATLVLLPTHRHIRK